MASWLTARNSNLTAFNAIAINYSTLLGSTITAGSTITGSTILDVSIQSRNIITSTLLVNSSMLSLGTSTNQTYSNVSQGSIATGNWVQSLTSLTNTKIVGSSASAQYQLAVTTTSSATSLYNTSTLGQSWTNISAASGLPTATQTSYTSGAISPSGQYEIVTAYGGYPYVTSTFGASFQNVNQNTPTVYMPLDTVPANSSQTGGTIPGTVTITTGANAPTLVTGIAGTGAMNLTNTVSSAAQQYLSVTWNTTGVTSFSWSFWINPQSRNAVQNICTSYGGVTGVYISASNLITFVVNSVIIAATSYPITTNAWYKITVIFQAGSTGYLYVNDALIPSVATCPLTAGVSSTSFSLGCPDNSTTNPYNGYIDDVKIYNTAITQSPMVPLNYSYSVLSANGQYMLATATGRGLFLSVNYGATWSAVTSGLLAATWQGLVMSGTGQYMAAYVSPVIATPQLLTLATTSWSVNGITWTASASSTNSAGNAVYRAFDNANGNSWFSNSTTTPYNTNGSVSASNSTTTVIGATPSTTVQGEWIQIQSSVPVVLTSFAFGIGSNAYPNTNTPRQYSIAGSTDGITWYLLQTGTFAITGFTGTTSTITVNSTSTQTFTAGMTGNVITVANASYVAGSYTYFRLIGTQIMNYGAQTSNYMEIGEWYANFTAGGQLYSTTYGSTWTAGYTIPTPSCLAISGNGQYALGANNLIPYLVPGYLSGFSTNTYTTPTLTGITAAITATALSNSGQYQVIVTSGTTNNVYYSTNYGSTFTATTVGSTGLTSCSVSYSGLYITVANATTVYTLNNNSTGYSLSLGNQAGAVNQGNAAIAIGNQAGIQSQGINAIAIGNQSATQYQASNSIVLNGLGSAVNAYYPGFFVAPVSSYTGSSSLSWSILGYGSDNQIVQGLGSANATNLFVGLSAGQNNTTGAQNTFIGTQAGLSITTGSYNTLVGCMTAAPITTGQQNSLIGSQAGNSITTGSYNTLMGTYAGFYATTASNNTIMGVSAGYNTVANNNTLLGYNAGFNNTTGYTNVIIGSSAGTGITTGAQNVIIGSSAGTTANMTGQNNVLIGQGAQLMAAGEFNEIVIGQGVTGSGTNSVTIGQMFAQTFQNATYVATPVVLSPLPSYGMYIISVYSGLSGASYSAAMYTAYYGPGNNGTTVLQAMFTGSNVTLTGTANGGVTFVGSASVTHAITYTKMGRIL